MMKLANLTATTAIGKEAVFLVSKSAETFLQMLTEQSVHFARAGKRKKVRTGGSPSERARALHAYAHACTRPMQLRAVDLEHPSPRPSPNPNQVIEDDIGFTAPLNELIDAYSDSHADLITDTPQVGR